MDQPVTQEQRQARWNEFLKLMPLTLELAGLAKADPGRPFTPDQIEGRVMSIKAAYKAARGLLKDVGEGT